ncbi:MAG: hypothetical protein ACRC37_07790 [Lentisphaeria bacterium]
MNFNGYGILLFTEKFNQCVHFYRDIMKLPIIFQEENILTNFRLSESCYLMVENFGKEAVECKDLYRNPTVIRFDTQQASIKYWLKYLNENNIKAKEIDYDWGHTISFNDPDGNRCEIYAPLNNMPNNFTTR